MELVGVGSVINGPTPSSLLTGMLHSHIALVTHHNNLFVRRLVALFVVDYFFSTYNIYSVKNINK